MTESNHCGDCAAAPGELHNPGCPVERCAICGGQRISCGCADAVNMMDHETLELHLVTMLKRYNVL